MQLTKQPAKGVLKPHKQAVNAALDAKKVKNYSKSAVLAAMKIKGM